MTEDTLAMRGFVYTYIVIWIINKTEQQPLRIKLLNRVNKILNLRKSPSSQHQTGRTENDNINDKVIESNIDVVGKPDYYDNDVKSNNNTDDNPDYDDNNDDINSNNNTDDNPDYDDNNDDINLNSNTDDLNTNSDDEADDLFNAKSNKIFSTPHIGGFLQVPNITERSALFKTMINTTIQNHANVKYGFPIKQIVNATLNKGIYPTIIPNQTQQIPSLERDIYCNPSLMAGGCSSLADWGRAIGIPIKTYLANSQIASILQRVAGTTNLLYESVSRGFTESLIDFMEMDGHIQQLESSIQNLTNVFRFDRNRDVIPQLLSNLSSLLIFDNGLFFDPDTPQHAFKNVMKDKVKSAALCRLSNGRLPNCDLVPFSDLPKHSHTGPTNDLGFHDSVIVYGYAEGCSLYHGCVAGDKTINGSLFDGIYIFADVDDSTGYPIYWKPFHSNDFPNIHSLLLWQKSYQGKNTDLISKNGIYAAITPNQANFDYALFETFAPYAIRYGIEGPASCQPTNFPDCLNDDSHWVLSRFSGGQFCSGQLYNSRVCQWKVPHIHYHPIVTANETN